MIHIFKVKIWKVPSAWYPLCGHSVDSFYRYYSLWFWFSGCNTRVFPPWRNPWFFFSRDCIAQLPGWVWPRGTDCFLGDPGVTIVYPRSMIDMFWFGCFVWIVLSMSVLKVFQVFSLGVETSLLSTWRILALRLINAWPESARTRINLLKHWVIKVFSKEKLVLI